LIRKALASDAAPIRRVAEDAYAVYAESLGRPPAPMVADFERHIREDWVIVAERDSRIDGYAVLKTNQGRALLDNIAVDPALQRSGLGSALIERVERHAFKCGHDRLELYTNVVMTDSFRWYQKLGFVETRRITEDGFHRIYMEKAIGREV
jgi:ribosomal protein S18 acetylase RimI-like enzyme